jgi:hypothetical protein
LAYLDEEFTRAMGRPSPATPNGLHFEKWFQSFWERHHPNIGSGWFLDGFVYLFGEGLTDFVPCVDAWSFLVPSCSDRMIIGRNAYGALLVMDDASDPKGMRIRVLDPWTVTYDGAPGLDFESLLARALPKRELVDFLDDGAYRQWLVENKVDRLELHDVLGIKVPKALGGKLVASNLQLDGMLDYYRTTGPIYADALARS